MTRPAFTVTVYLPEGFKLVTKGVGHTGKEACIRQQGGTNRSCIALGQDRQMGDNQKMLN